MKREKLFWRASGNAWIFLWGGTGKLWRIQTACPVHFSMTRSSFSILQISATSITKARKGRLSCRRSDFLAPKPKTTLSNPFKKRREAFAKGIFNNVPRRLKLQNKCPPFPSFDRTQELPSSIPLSPNSHQFSPSLFKREAGSYVGYPNGKRI